MLLVMLTSKPSKPYIEPTLRLEVAKVGRTRRSYAALAGLKSQLDIHYWLKGPAKY